MKLDERARTTARATRERFAAVAAPDAGAVVRRAEWPVAALAAGDDVEIVRPLQGG